MLGSWKSDFHRVFEVDWRLLVGHSINGYDANSDSSLVSRACRGKPFDREWWTHSLLNEIDDSWLSSTNSETKAQYLTQLFAAKYWNILECSTRKDLDEPFFLNCVVCPQLRLHEVSVIMTHQEPRTIWHQCSQRSWPSAPSLAAWQWLFGWLTLPRWWVLGSLYSAYRCVYIHYIYIYHKHMHMHM